MTDAIFNEFGARLVIDAIFNKFGARLATDANFNEFGTSHVLDFMFNNFGVTRITGNFLMALELDQRFLALIEKNFSVPGEKKNLRWSKKIRDFQFKMRFKRF